MTSAVLSDKTVKTLPGRAAAQAVLTRLGLLIDVNAVVASLSIAQQQMVEIARALTRASRVGDKRQPGHNRGLRANRVLLGAGGLCARLTPEFSQGCGGHGL